MSHRVLYVEKSNELKLYLDNLKVILESNDEVLFPISDIMILVIDNYRSTISVPLINKLTENNVCTILCDYFSRSAPAIRSLSTISKYAIHRYDTINTHD